MEAEVKAASVKWVGEGTWTPESICFDWDNDSYQVWVCTNTNGSSLANGDSVDLTCAESTEFVCPWTQYYWIGTFEIKLFTSYLHFLFIWILIQLSSHVCVSVSVSCIIKVFSDVGCQVMKTPHWCAYWSNYTQLNYKKIWRFLLSN